MSSQLFCGISFHLIPSNTFRGSEVDDIRQKIIDHGGFEAPLRLTGSSQSDPVIRDEYGFFKDPIVVSDSIEFPEYGYIEDNMISIVLPDWIVQCIEKNILVPLRPFSPDPKYILSQIFVCVSDQLSSGDKEALYGAVAALGGLFYEKITDYTTHYISLSINDARSAQINAKLPKIKIILPHWIDDCLRLRRRLDEAPYLFPNPPILQGKNALSPANAKNGLYLSYKEQLPEVAWKSTVLKDKIFCFGRDLKLSDRAIDTVKKLVEQAGGEITDEILEANVYIGHYRSGSQYAIATQHHLYVGNLTWLYWIIFHDKWISPLRKLLHYPISKTGIPAMNGKVIAITNYTGESRTYLEQLISASGARFTKQLTADNTHLIAATTKGEKIIAARKWGVDVVNHLWLEESYASWQVQPVSLPRYSQIANRLNLNNLVGQTQLIPRILAQFYNAADTEAGRLVMDSEPPSPSTSLIPSSAAKYQKESEEENEKEHENEKADRKQSHKVTEEQEEKSDEQQQDKTADDTDNTENKNEPWSSRILSVFGRNSKSIDENHTRETDSQADRPMDHDEPIGTPHDQPGDDERNGGHNAQLNDERNDELNDKHDDQSRITSPTTDIPSTPAYRDTEPPNTVDELNISQDISSRTPSMSPTPRRAIIASAESQNGSSTPEESTPKERKRVAISGTTNKKKVRRSITVLITGIEVIYSKHELRRVGIELATKPENSQVIIAQKFARTENFLCALPTAEYVVKPKYLHDCLTGEKYIWPIPPKYWIKDKKLDHALKRVKEMREKATRLFSGMEFNVSPHVRSHVPDGFQVLKHIALCQGASSFLEIKSPKTKKYVKSKEEQYILISEENEENDEALVESFIRYDSDIPHFIKNSAWLLDCITNMEVKMEG